MTNICRLCTKADKNLISVFENIQENLHGKILHFFGVNILNDDPITQNICRSCYILTNSIYDYRVTFSANDSKLKQEYERTCAQQKEIIKPNYLPADMLQDDFLQLLNLTRKDLYLHLQKLINKYRLRASSVTNKTNFYPKVDMSLNNKYNEWMSAKNNLVNSETFDLNKTTVTNEIYCPSTLKSLESGAAKDKKKLANATNKKKHKSVDSKRKPKNEIQRLFSNQTNKSNHPEKLWNITNSNSLAKRMNTEESNEIPRKVRKLLENKTQSFEETQKSKVTTLSLENKSSLFDNDVVECDNELILSKISNKENDITSQIYTKEAENFLVYASEIKTFFCQTCSSVFDTAKTLQEHKKTEHQLALRCNICAKKFVEIESLLKHNRKFHPENVSNEPNQKENGIISKLPEDITNKIGSKRKEKIPEKKTKDNIQKNIPYLFISLDSEEEDDVENKNNDSKNSTTQNENDSSNIVHQPQEVINVIKENKPEATTATNGTIKNLEVTQKNKVTIFDNDLVESNKAISRDAVDEEVIIIEDSDNEDDPVIIDKQTNTLDKDETRTVNIKLSQKIEKNYEQNLFNYIFSRYLYSETTTVEIDSKWILKDIKKVAKQCIIPIDLHRSTNKMVMIEYSLVDLESRNKTKTLISWDIANAIDIPTSNTNMSNFLSNVIPVGKTATTIANFSMAPESPSLPIVPSTSIPNSNFKMVLDSPSVPIVSSRMPPESPSLPIIPSTSIPNSNFKMALDSPSVPIVSSRMPPESPSIPPSILQPIILNRFKAQQLTHTANMQTSEPKLVSHFELHTNVSTNQSNIILINSEQTELITSFCDTNFTNTQQETVLTTTPNTSISIQQNDSNCTRSLIRIKSPAELNTIDNDVIVLN